MSDTNETPKNAQYKEWNNDVDYRVKVKPKPKPQNSFWQKVVMALLIIAICAGLAIIVIQTSRISSLENQNTNLQATVEVLQTQNSNLLSTVDAMQKLLTPTPKP